MYVSITAVLRFRERQCELGKQSARADRECSVNRDLGGESHKVSRQNEETFPHRHVEIN